MNTKDALIGEFESNSLRSKSLINELENAILLDIKKVKEVVRIQQRNSEIVLELFKLNLGVSHG